MPLNSNLSFAQSVVEQLAGDSNLIAVRSRASRERPFTVVQKMQADAEANYRSKIKELEQNLAETQRKVNELQQSKDAGQRFILSPEQQQELVNFPQEGSRRENSAQRNAQETAGGDRFARESDQVDQHRRDAGRGGPGRIRPRGHETNGPQNERQTTRTRPGSARRRRRRRFVLEPA